MDLCRFKAILLLILSGYFFAANYAQSNKLNALVSVQFNNLGFEAARNVLEPALGVYFQFNSAIVPSHKLYSLKLYNTKGRTVLSEFLSQAGLGFTEAGSNVFLYKNQVRDSVRTAKPIYYLSGYITQDVNGEFLSSAEITIPSSHISIYSNSGGYFSLALHSDTNVIRISYPGFHSVFDTIIGDRNYQNNYLLHIKESVQNIEIHKQQNKEDLSLSGRSILEGQTDHFYLSKNKTKWLPSMLGEADILKAISLFPGVVNGSEGLMGMYIRGGDANQNLVLLDDVPVFNSYHLFGIFSVFNDEFVKSAELMKGSFPARYGGRLSSVISIQSKEGNNYKFRGSANIGILSSKVFLEGPIIKGRTTFVVSFRRSYLDFLTTPLARFFLFNDSLKNNIYYFWDVNARITHKFNQKSRLTFSFYKGLDKAGLFEKTIVDNATTKITEQRSQLSGWGNTLFSGKWVYQFNKKHTFYVKGHYTEYGYSYNQNYSFKKDFYNLSNSDINDFTSYNLKNGISDLDASLLLETVTEKNNKTSLGAGICQHHFIPGNRSLLSKIDSSEKTIHFNDLSVFNNELYAFFEKDIQFENNFFVNAGLRYQVYFLKNQNYFHLPEYRLNIKHKFAKGIWTRIGATRTWQFFHLLNNLSLGLPSDLWVPSTVNLKPAQCDQFSLGLSKSKKDWQFGSEIFYKYMKNLLEYRDNASYLTSAINWEEAVTQGIGRVYGLEMYAERNIGKWNGWLAYTLMWNKRKFAELNSGEFFPYRYDRRNSIYFTLIYHFNKKITFSVNWIYNTGFWITLPTGKYSSPTPNDPYREIYVYGNRNNARVNDNHRLDFTFNFKREHKYYIRTISIGLFNAYNRQNPFYLRFGYDKNGNRKLYQISLLPILPNISYKVDF